MKIFTEIYNKIQKRNISKITKLITSLNTSNISINIFYYKYFMYLNVINYTVENNQLSKKIPKPVQPHMSAVRAGTSGSSTHQSPTS